MRLRHAARGAAAALAVGAALGGCGSGPDENAAREARELAPQPRAACPGTVMHTLVQIAKHVYGEGISSERTRVAYNVIAPVPCARRSNGATPGPRRRPRRRSWPAGA